MLVAALDLETTGLRFNTDQVVEFCVMTCTHVGKIISYMSGLCDTDLEESAWDPKAIATHGIRASDVQGLPLFGTYVKPLYSALHDSGVRILVGHNIKYFDCRFLDGYGFPVNEFIYCDTMIDAGTKKWVKLEEAALNHGIELPQNMHRASFDAHVSLTLAIRSGMLARTMDSLREAL